MSSPKLKHLARFAAVAGLTLGLSACFRPLYGPTASGESLQTTFASIDVSEPKLRADQARFGHYLYSELVYALNGSGSDTPKHYTLDMTFTQSLSTPIVDTQTGQASSATISGKLDYKLMSSDGKTIVTQGTATASASYDRFQQRFATVRAGRDAEIRLAKLLSEQVKNRLAAALSARSS